MSWIKLTPAHLDEALAAAELAALRTVQTAVGQKDPVPQAITRTCNEVCGYVAAAGLEVGEPGTIPEQLLSGAIAIVRWRIISRLSVGAAAKVFATENRRQEYLDAIALLKDVATRKFIISLPEEPAEDQPRASAAGVWGSATKF